MSVNTVSHESLTTADRDELRKTLRSYLEQRMTPADVRVAMMPGTGNSRALWRELADDLGVQALGIRESAGGAGYGIQAIALVLSELGRALYPGPYFSTVVLAAGLLESADDDEVADAWLGAIARGELTATVALHETSGGVEIDSCRTEGRRTSEGWVVSGKKLFVSDGAEAQLLLVPAQTADGVAVFAVEREAISAVPLSTFDLTRPLADVTFDDVPAQLVISAPRAANALACLIDTASALLTAEQVGASERVLEFTVQYSMERFQFGRPIGSFQAVKHDCAEMLLAIEGSRAISDATIEDLIGGSSAEPGMIDAAAAYASDAFVNVAETAVQVHGGMGITWEHPCHLYLKRAKSDSIMLRSSRERRVRIADQLGL